MKAIEQIYENYKASQNEETPYSEEQPGCDSVGCGSGGGVRG